MRLHNTLFLLAFTTLISVQPVMADSAGQEEAAKVESTQGEPGALGLEGASGEKLAKATAHYARARSLLIAAVNEFDKGYKIATPDALLDSREWRTTLIDRAEELQKVLDPQPRASREGLRFDADTRLLNEAGR
jgi:hypothetical protein